MKTIRETIEFINEGISNLGLSKKVQKKHEDKDILEDFDEFVDLGLPSGIRWAKCNVGATSEEEYGDYFSYEEIGKLSKGNIRVPDNTDWAELKRYCTIEFDSLRNDVKGIIVRSKKDPTKYIFLPCAGFDVLPSAKLDTNGLSYTGIGGYYLLRNIYGYIFQFVSSINHLSFQNSLHFKDTKYSVRLIEVPSKKKKKLQESSNLGLSNKVSKKYSEKKPEDAYLFDHVVDLDTLREFFKENGTSVSDITDTPTSEGLYKRFFVNFGSHELIEIRYNTRRGDFFVANSDVDRIFKDIAKTNQDFRRCIIWRHKWSYGTFRLDKEQPVPKFVLDIILEAIQKYIKRAT